MRSLVALMACIGCIAWVHSCEKRLLGVSVGTQPESMPSLAAAPAALPVVNTVPPAYNAAIPALLVDRRMSTPASHLKRKKQLGKAQTVPANSQYTQTVEYDTAEDSSFFNAMVIKHLNYNAAILTP